MNKIDELADRHDRLYERHRETLGSQTTVAVCLVADRAFLETYSGQVTWATLLNLVVRLYKGIRQLRIAVEPGITRLPYVFFPNDLPDIREASLQMLADLDGGYVMVEEGTPVDGDDAVQVYVGKARASVTAGDITIAGRGWVAFVNDDGWRCLSDDENPLGPMAAAALGTAQIYRHLYGSRATVQDRIVFSTFRHTDPSINPPMPKRIHLPRTFVPGAGAIGMSFLLVLQSILGIQSSDGLLVIDDDTLDATNLNRCLIAILEDLVGDAGVPYKKVHLIERRLIRPALNLKPVDKRWEEFVEQPEYADPRMYELVVSCVDKYEARKAVQFAKAPRLLITAGTGDFLLSISRHRLDDEFSCGLCYQLRDRAPTCAKASEGAQDAFEKPIDPSIGFVSALAGVLLAAEYLKEIQPVWQAEQVKNAARLQVLSGKLKTGPRRKDVACNCSSKFVVQGYKDVWKSAALPVVSGTNGGPSAASS